MIIFLNRYFLGWIGVSTILLFIFGGGSAGRGANSVVGLPTIIIVAIAAFIWWRRDVNRRKVMMRAIAEQNEENARKAALYDQERVHGPQQVHPNQDAQPGQEMAP